MIKLDEIERLLRQRANWGVDTSEFVDAVAKALPALVRLARDCEAREWSLSKDGPEDDATMVQIAAEVRAALREFDFGAVERKRVPPYDGGMLYRWRNSQDCRLQSIPEGGARHLLDGVERVGTVAEYLGVGSGELISSGSVGEGWARPLRWVVPQSVVTGTTIPAGWSRVCGKRITEFHDCCLKPDHLGECFPNPVRARRAEPA